MINEHISNKHIMVEIGSRFAAARINKDLGQAELSRLSGVSEKTIGHLENGRKSVGLLNIIAIIRALGLIDELEHFMPKPPPSVRALLVDGKKIKTRKRASSKANLKDQAEDAGWSWED